MEQKHLIAVEKMVWSEKNKAPIFILKDGRIMEPVYSIGDGSSFSISWEVSKQSTNT